MKTVKLILGIVTIGMIVASCNKEVQEPVNPTNSSTSGTNFHCLQTSLFSVIITAFN